MSTSRPEQDLTILKSPVKKTGLLIWQLLQGISVLPVAFSGIDGQPISVQTGVGFKANPEIIPPATITAIIVKIKITLFLLPVIKNSDILYSIKILKLKNIICFLYSVNRIIFGSYINLYGGSSSRE